MDCDCYKTINLPGGHILYLDVTLEGFKHHDHINCSLCHPILEEADHIIQCSSCGENMVVNSTDGASYKHHCGKLFFIDALKQLVYPISTRFKENSRPIQLPVQAFRTKLVLVEKLV